MEMIKTDLYECDYINTNTNNILSKETMKLSRLITSGRILLFHLESYLNYLTIFCLLNFKSN